MRGRCFRCSFDCLAEYGCGDNPSTASGPPPFRQGRLEKLKEKYRKWKFVRVWNKKNANWRECRHKRKRRAEAMRKAGIL